MSEELKPCPFCGGKAHSTVQEFTPGDEIKYFYCVAPHCMAVVSFKQANPAKTDGCFNSRIPSPEELAALRERVKSLESILSVAACPDANNSGHEVAYQCQWCDERNALLQGQGG